MHIPGALLTSVMLRTIGSNNTPAGDDVFTGLQSKLYSVEITTDRQLFPITPVNSDVVGYHEGPVDWTLLLRWLPEGNDAGSMGLIYEELRFQQWAGWWIQWESKAGSPAFSGLMTLQRSAFRQMQGLDAMLETTFKPYYPLTAQTKPQIITDSPVYTARDDVIIGGLHPVRPG